METNLTVKARANLREIQKTPVGKAKELENRLHHTKSKSVKKLLDVNPMVLYDLFRVDGTHLESVLNLVHTLEHGFYDDGEICLVRKEQEVWCEGFEDIVETQYDYEIVDIHDYEQQCLTDEEVYDILESADKSYLYYKHNCDKIEHWSSKKYMRWLQIQDEHEQFFEKRGEMK